MQHHVGGGDAAGARDAVAVDGEQCLAYLDFRMVLPEERHRLPMERHRIAVEQAGSRERELAGVDRTEERTVAIEPPEPGEHAPPDLLFRMVAGEDDDGRKERRVGQAEIGNDGHAVAGRDRLSVGGDQVGRK